SFGRRGPLVHDRAVRDVDEPEAADRCSGCLGRRRQRRHHRIQERQRNYGPHPAKERPARQGHLGDDHVCRPLYVSFFTFIRNGSLVAIPTTIEENLYPSRAWLTMRLTIGSSDASRPRPTP